MAPLLAGSANGLSLPLAVGTVSVLVAVGVALVLLVASFRRNSPPR
jgi:hypothetical protein